MKQVMVYKAINILQFTSSSQIGGVETVLIDVLKHINKNLFNVFVCSLRHDGDLLEKIEHLAVNTKHLNLRNFLDFTVLLKLYKFLKENRIQLMQTHGLTANVVGRIVGKLAKGPKIISTIHGIDLWRKCYHTYLDRLTGVFVDRFLSVSEEGREVFSIREKFPRKKIVTIHNGINLNRFNKASFNSLKLRYKLGFHENDIIIGEVANIRKMKGHRDVIEVIPSIVKHCPNAKFLFVGRDDSNGEIPQLAVDKGIGEYVIFLGYCENIPELLSIFDIFILPSHSEGLPVSILEAMAMELPVIATNVGGIPEIVVDGETGILIEPNKPDELANALLDLLNNPKRRYYFGKSGRKRVEDKFNINRMISNIENLYLEVLRVESKHHGI